MVHLATGILVVRGVIREGAILTNCFANWWSVASAWQAHFFVNFWSRRLIKVISAFLYSLKFFFNSTLSGDTDQDLTVGPVQCWWGHTGVLNIQPEGSVATFTLTLLSLWTLLVH